MAEPVIIRFCRKAEVEKEMVYELARLLSQHLYALELLVKPINSYIGSYFHMYLRVLLNMNRQTL